MGFFSSIARGIKGLFKGIGRVFKAVIKSPIGIAALAAGAYLGGGALGWWSTPFESINNAWVSPASASLTQAQAGQSQIGTGLVGGGKLAMGGGESMVDVQDMVGSPPTTPGDVIQVATTQTTGITAPPVSAASSPGLIDTGAGILKNATKWLADNPVPALIMGNMLTSAFTPDALDTQNNAAKNQMELEDWRRQYAAANTNVGLINTRILPSGRTLQNLSPNPAVPYPVR